jgi:hypothetical protein
LRATSMREDLGCPRGAAELENLSISSGTILRTVATPPRPARDANEH